MGDIFDRLSDLFKSWVAPDADSRPFSGSRPFGEPNRPFQGMDSDFDDAMAELEADLAGDRAARERLEREREARRRAEDERRSAGSGGSAYRSGPDPRERLAADYRTLGVPVGAPFAEVKSAYKKLQKAHHPDRHMGSAEASRKATETSARINAAYSRLERYAETGHFPADD